MNLPLRVECEGLDGLRHGRARPVHLPGVLPAEQLADADRHLDGLRHDGGGGGGGGRVGKGVKIHESQLN